MDDLPKIDLYNLNDERFSNCRYVLTSPRSLEACEKLNIKPNELLYVPKEEFSKKYHNFPKKKLDQLFEYQENSRKMKLTKARYERNLLMDMKSDHKNNYIEQTHQMGYSNNAEYSSASKWPNSNRQAEQKEHLTATLPSQYEKIMKKLPPNEVKRLKLAFERCQKSCNDVPGVKAVDLTVIGQKPSNDNFRITHQQTARPRSSACRTVLDMETRRAKAPVCRRLSTGSSSKEYAAHSRRSSGDRDKAREIERRLEQARERRRQLEELLQTYRRQLQETLELTQKTAHERANQKILEEQHKKLTERQLRQENFRQKSKELQERQEEARKANEIQQRIKDEYVQRLIEQKEAKIQESRNLALAAEQLREDMLRVYNLDSFDKKVQKVTLFNDLGLGGSGQ